MGHQAFGIPAVQAVVEVRPAAGWLGAAGSCMHAPHCLSWHQDRRPEQKHTAPAALHLTPAYHLLPITPATRPPLSQFKWRKWARRMLLGELAFFCLWAVSFFTFTVLFQASRCCAIYVAADMADAAVSRPAPGPPRSVCKC